MPLVGIAFARISGYRVVARYDVVGIPGFRVKHRVTPHSMRGPVAWVTPHYDAGSIGGYYLCQYSWIPHQVRNDVKHRVVARYDVEHRITAQYDV